jgi:hypothetical protein
MRYFRRECSVKNESGLFAGDLFRELNAGGFIEIIRKNPSPDEHYFGFFIVSPLMGHTSVSWSAVLGSTMASIDWGIK